MINNIIISGIQFDIVWEDKKANFKKLEYLISDISSDTDVIFLPEMFTTGFSMNSKKLAETMKGNSVSWMKNISRSLNKVIAGSLIIYDGEEYRNRFIWVDSGGEINFYDKKYLFTPGGEAKFYKNGEERKVFEYKGWRIFPSICYDLRFPEWLKNDINYDIIINVASWPQIRAKHWKTFLRSRAIENQSYFAGINRIGVDGRNITYSGDSSIYDFDGNLLAELGNIEGIVNAVFSKDKLMDYRKQFPFLKDKEK